MRRNLALILIGVGILVLAIELYITFPRLAEWHPWDYGNYLRMGHDVRAGNNPYGLDRYYPLPTMLWIFVPLSLLPEWFKVVWIFFAFVFVLILLRGDGVLAFLYPPFWFIITDAMFDAWLLLPLAWVFANRPMLAGLGAAFLLFKPHVTFLAVAYIIWHWLVTRDWNNLKVFALTMSALWLPSFIVNPRWVWQMWEVLSLRTNQVSLLPLLTTSLWSWWCLGGIATIIFVALALLSAILFVRALRHAPQRAAAFQSLGLLINPVILASNLILILPMLRGRQQILAIVILGWLALILDKALNNFGGGYALIPLAALYFLTREAS
ncbi:MAG: hypothetical protein N2559_09240 [Anaerolineae bacterium]|nr:hypothetical protein [Anaerolineae bacterium]